MIHFRLYKTGDEHDIISLSRKVFPQFVIDISVWNWLYNKNKKNIFLAFDGETLIGHWAYLNKSIQVKSKIFLSGLTLGAMVHPDYQGQKIFSRLGMYALSHISNRSIDLLYGFPNDKSLHVHEKIFFFKEIKTFSLFKKEVFIDKQYAHGKSSCLYFEKSNTLKEINDLSDHVKLRKNTAYLHYRYLCSPHNKYFIYKIYNRLRYIGFLVFKKYMRDGNNHMQLIDMDIKKKYIDNIFFKEIYFFWNFIARRYNTVFLSTWGQQLDMPEDFIINEFNFRKDDSKNFHLCLKSIKSTMKCTCFQPWLIRMGDTELF